MKAYQVYSGDIDKHDRQYYSLDSTYLSYEKALERCEEIIKPEILKGEEVEQTGSEGRIWWTVEGWEPVIVCKLEEITITE